MMPQPKTVPVRVLHRRNFEETLQYYCRLPKGELVMLKYKDYEIAHSYFAPRGPSETLAQRAFVGTQDKPGVRSTSIGDAIEVNGVLFLVAPIGFVPAAFEY